MKKQKCQECGELTLHSFFREDENETVCEDCWIEYIKQKKFEVIDLHNPDCKYPF